MLTSEYLKLMQNFQTRLHKKVKDVETKKELIRKMYKESLVTCLSTLDSINTKVRNNIYETMKRKD